MIEQVFNILQRDAVAIYNPDTLKEKLMSQKVLKVKLGADPSRPDLHLGHSVVLRKLKLFQDLGHQIIFVIGDFTGMIGDPSGKSKTRVPLTFDQTRANAQSYMDQVTKILDKDKTQIVFNAQWLADMNFSQVMSLASKYTLARIMERDDFSKRFSDHKPIGIHELFYPLMQGYDSVALEADIEIGGSDQTFNLLVGRELQRDYDQAPQEVITFPLLIGLDGKEKMSKSLDNYIGLAEPPEVMYEKCMKVPDALLHTYFELTTDLDASRYQALLKEDMVASHKLYAATIVDLYHGSGSHLKAQERYSEVAQGKIPTTLESLFLDKQATALVDILIQAGFSQSKSASKRLILGGGVKINQVTIKDPLTMVQPQEDLVVSKGKNHFVRLCFQ